MANNPLIRISELGLFAFLILHTIQGLSLYFKNKSKRTQAYKVSAGNATSKWYSRSMAILGTLILLFLVMHLNHFWVPSRITGLVWPTGSALSYMPCQSASEIYAPWAIIQESPIKIFSAAIIHAIM